MEQAERKELEGEILKRITKVEGQIEELKEFTQAVEPDCAIGRVSRMDAINNKSINDAALNKKKLQLQGLKAVLNDIDTPDFGKCLVCGAEIQKERILLMPENRKCIKCARRR
jgi:DnaK suppressor protein